MAAGLKVLIAAIAWSGAALVATAESGPKPATAFDRALARVDLRRAGTPPLRLRARVVTTGPEGEQVAGNYHWLWVSPTSWREEIAFPGFWEATGRSGEKSWRKRRLDFTAQEIGWAYEALRFADRLRRGATWSEEAPEQRKIHGVEQSCIKVNMTDAAWRRWCFDAGSGDLLREEGLDDLGQGILVTYDKWREALGKRFPGTISYTVDKRKRVELKVTEFEDAHENDSATFLAPEGAEAMPVCDSPIMPAVPVTALRALTTSGSAAVEARIGSDGKVKRVRVVAASSKEFARKLAEKIAAATFTPATCDGQPVEIDQLFRQAVR